MYNYTETQDFNLNFKDIIDNIDQEEVFKKILKEEVIIDFGKTRYKAPYREDSTGDCYFRYFDNELRFVDFAYEHVTQNCIQFLSSCLNLTLIEAANIIKNNKEFQVDVVKNKSYLVKSKINEKRNNEISYCIRQFDLKDKNFWYDKYKITSKQLLNDGVYPITAYRAYNVFNKPYTINTFDITYVYTQFEGDKVKIYRPYNKDYKWYTNCNQNDIGSIKTLPNFGDILIITKSYKDCRVIRNLGYNSVWFQNEGMLPDDKLLLDLINRFNKIYIWFDNDVAGQSALLKVLSKFKSLTNKEVKGIFLPPILNREEGIKDPSDFISKKGIEELSKFIKSKLE